MAEDFDSKKMGEKAQRIADALGKIKCPVHNVNAQAFVHLNFKADFKGICCVEMEELLGDSLVILARD